jgi:hypothetical protein
MPIVFIEYENSGLTNSDLKNAVKDYKEVKFITKDSDGMFDSDKAEKELSKYLRSKRIGNLIITGANGGACVKSSIDGSLANNYNIISYPPGIADFNYEDFIYPYTYGNEYFSPNCSSCSFVEVDRIDKIKEKILLRKKVNTKSHKSIDDSGREVITKDKTLKTTPSSKLEQALQH